MLFYHGHSALEELRRIQQKSPVVCFTWLEKAYRMLTKITNCHGAGFEVIGALLGGFSLLLTHS